MSSMAMSVADRERFLADLHVGIVSVTEPGDRGPLMTPVWYAYEPGGEIKFSTNTDSRKLARIKKAGRIGFIVQDERVPYRYVAVEGSITCEPADSEEFRQWSLRYLGPETGQKYFTAVEDGMAGMTTVRLRPDRWRTFNFAAALQ